MGKFKRSVAMLLASAMLTSNCPAEVFAQGRNADQYGILGQEISTDVRQESKISPEFSISKARNPLEQRSGTQPPTEDTKPQPPTEDTKPQPPTEDTKPQLPTEGAEPQLPTEDRIPQLPTEGTDPSNPQDPTGETEALPPESLLKGTCGADLSWSFAGGILTISGTGAMDDYSADPGAAASPWRKFASEIHAVVFPEGLTYIGQHAFRDVNKITGGLNLPAGLLRIGSGAFAGCTSVSGKLVIPDRVSRIDDGALQGMTGVTSLVLGSNTLNLIGNPFSGMDGLRSVTCRSMQVPENIGTLWKLLSLTEVSVPEEAYETYAAALKLKMPLGCTLRSSGTQGDFLIRDGVLLGYFGQGGEVVIPDGVTRIANLAFARSTKVTYVICNEELTSIGQKAFYECSALEEIQFPRQMDLQKTYDFIIEEYSFYNCDALLSLALPRYISIIERYAFAECSHLTDGLVVPGEVTSVAEHAFEHCTSLKSVVFQEGVQNIEQHAFYNCTAMQTISFPESMHTIGTYAFAGCSALTGSLEIPGAVISIGDYAFQNCKKLNGTLTIADGDRCMIGTGAFYDCTSLTGLKLGNGIHTVGSSAFYNCYQMQGELVLPPTIEAIGSQAFAYCRGFTGQLILPEKLVTLGSGAFSYCSGITGELKVPDGITEIPSSAFCGMSKVSSLILGPNVKKIYTYYSSSHAFYDMTALQEITFLSAAVPTPYYSSYGILYPLSGLKTVNVPAESYTAYSAAFQNQLPSGATIKSIGVSGDFQVQDGVLIAYLGEGGEVVLPDGITAIGDRAFMNNRTITGIQMNNTVKTVGTRAFYGCSNLQSVIASPVLENIGDYAFYNCTALTNLQLSDRLMTIGIRSFYNCNKLQ